MDDVFFCCALCCSMESALDLQGWRHFLCRRLSRPRRGVLWLITLDSNALRKIRLCLFCFWVYNFCVILCASTERSLPCGLELCPWQSCSLTLYRIWRFVLRVSTWMNAKGSILLLGGSLLCAIYRSKLLVTIVHRPFFYLKHDVSETGFCLYLQVEPTDFGGSVMLKALGSKPEGRGFENRWGENLNLPNPSDRTRLWGLLSL
jgi:hypothetical protein